MAADHRATWRRLTTPGPSAGTFDPADVEHLPDPARRLLRHALRPGVTLAPTVTLDMTGSVRIGRWMPFRARQVLTVGAGFMWAPRVGRGPMVVTGADVYERGRGVLDFRLWGLLPVAHESGPDTDRSAAGRLAAETVVWAPQGLTPAMGATWSAVDDDRAIVHLPVDHRVIDVTVTVDARGRLRALSLQRWGDPDGRGARPHPFGGDVGEYRQFDGVTLASAGRVGWFWGTPRQADEIFFRYRITGARLHARGVTMPARP